ncbi:NGG1p interacting factor NIF3 [Pokkaliibacter sp. CJK22405]|uniref:NGG1p interacting factor NIF3 n=1 Tax=Pokkaliibacter sp. CJK22405 TaxID=3384615 RepID=UPI003984E05A
MYKLVVFIPDAHKESVKMAMFAAGAGRIGDYQHCAFETRGTGQFMPMAAANPFIGEAGQLERVDEWKVEVVCEEALLQGVIGAIRTSHPYEEPAFEVYALVDV